jgi:hypothetical protein
VAESALGQRIDLTNGGTLDIHAAPRFVLLLSVLAASGAVGTASGGGATAVLTRQRSLATDTLAAGYPSSLWMNTTQAMHIGQRDYRACLPRAPQGGSTPATASQQSELYALGIVWKGAHATGSFTTPQLASNLANGLTYASDLYVGLSGPYLWGRVYDVLVLGTGRSSHGDTCYAGVDADGFFAGAGGTQKAFRAIYSTAAPGGNVLLVPW